MTSRSRTAGAGPDPPRGLNLVAAELTGRSASEPCEQTPRRRKLLHPARRDEGFVLRGVDVDAAEAAPALIDEDDQPLYEPPEDLPPDRVVHVDDGYVAGDVPLERVCRDQLDLLSAELVAVAFDVDAGDLVEVLDELDADDALERIVHGRLDHHASFSRAEVDEDVVATHFASRECDPEAQPARGDVPLTTHVVGVVGGLLGVDDFRAVEAVEDPAYQGQANESLSRAASRH